jgi:hypothetical protein
MSTEAADGDASSAEGSSDSTWNLPNLVDLCLLRDLLFRYQVDDSGVEYWLSHTSAVSRTDGNGVSSCKKNIQISLDC